MTGAARARRREWAGAAALLLGLAVLVAYVLRSLLLSASDRLPGLDSGDLHAWEVYTRAVLAMGSLPHWNPYFFAGTPHLANNQTLVFYPLAWLLRWLDVPAFLGAMVVLHVWLAGAGAFVLARVAGVGSLAAAAAAVIVALGGSTGGRVFNGHLLVIYGTAFLPWALAFAILSVRRGGWLPHPGLVAVLVVQFLAGYLQGSIYIAAAVCAYYAFSVVWPERRTPTLAARLEPAAQLALAGVIAAGLAAFQLWPTARLAAESGRTAGMAYAEAAEGAWGTSDLATFFFPFHGADEQPPHRSLADRVAYVGWLSAAAIPFAFTGADRRRLAIFLALLALIAVLIASARVIPLYRIHHLLLPGLRLPTRVLFVSVVALAVLAAAGIERMASLARRRRWGPLAAGLLPGAVAMGAATGTAIGGSGAGLPVHAWPFVPVVSIAGLGIVVAVSRWAGPRPAIAAAVAILVFDLTAFTAGASETVPLVPARTVHEWLGPPVRGRAISFCESRVGAAAFLLNRQPALDGIAGMHLRDYTDWAYLARYGNAPPGDGLYRRIGTRDALPSRRDLIDMANTSLVVACAPLDLPALTLVSNHDSTYVYRNDAAWPRAVWTCAAEPAPRAVAATLLQTGSYDEQKRLVPRHFINVRFAPSVSAGERGRIERQYSLRNGVQHEGRTWRYALHDVSAANATALMRDPAVEDTHGLDRATGALSAVPGAAGSANGVGEPQVVTGTRECGGGSVAIAAADAPDGRVEAAVDAASAGVVFFSEPYYPERHAFVDDRRVTPQRANLAFTAVAVPAGRHTAELRYVPASFYQGTAASAMTFAIWLGFGIRRGGWHGAA